MMNIYKSIIEFIYITFNIINLNVDIIKIYATIQPNYSK